ncbi:MAG: hypothetical protein ACLP9L_39525 [Thermoguttaceae bacterium]
MRTWHTTVAVGGLATLLACAIPGQAQQATIATPYHTLHDSFFENSGISWSGNYRGFTFSYGGAALAVPQFGSPQSTAGLTTNFAFAGKDGQINFGLNFGQGNSQSLTTQTPSVTIMNGQTGYVSDTSLTPFVISVVPVVGAFPVSSQPLQQISGIDPNAVDPRVQTLLQAHADAQAQAEAQAHAQAQVGGPIAPLPHGQKPDDRAPKQNMKLMNLPDPAEAAEQRLSTAQESTAGRPALSVAEAKRLHQQELAAANGEMAALMVRARALEEDGKPNVAKIYYRRIVAHASGELQQQARTRLYELQKPESLPR